MMQDQTVAPPTREYIERLVKEEHRLLAQQTLADSDRFRIQEIHLAVVRFCDELRQRRVVGDPRQSLGQPRGQPQAIGR